MSLRAGDQLETAFETYTVVSTLGEGGSGVVYEVSDSDKATFAAKVLDKEKAGRTRLKRFKNEADFCSRNRHKNIVRVIGSGVTKTGASFYVMPFYPCTLRSLVSAGIKPGDVLPLYDQILSGVEAAHLQGIWHRDLKPENILYAPSDNNLVVADFGIAHFEEQELATFVKTKAGDRLANFLYAAPEQKDNTKTVTNKADVYALGLILHEMYLREVPLGTGYRKIGESLPDLSYLDPLTDRMLNQDPGKRPSIAEVKLELIARKNEFIAMQRLDGMKREVIPESEVMDPIVADPIRMISKENYQNGILTVRLSQPVNNDWINSFYQRATGFSTTFSSRNVTFQHDLVQIMVSERNLQQGVQFVKDYLSAAHENYVTLITRRRQESIEKRKLELRSKVYEEETRQRILKSVQL